MEDFDFSKISVVEKVNIKRFEKSKNSFLTFSFKQKQVLLSGYLIESEQLTANCKVFCMNNNDSKVIKYIGIIREPKNIRKDNKVFSNLSVYSDKKIARFSHREFINQVYRDYKISSIKTTSFRIYVDIENVRRDVPIPGTDEVMDIFQLFDVPSQRTDLRLSEVKEYEDYYNAEAAKFKGVVANSIEPKQ